MVYFTTGFPTALSAAKLYEIKSNAKSQIDVGNVIKIEFRPVNICDMPPIDNPNGHHHGKSSPSFVHNIKSA